MPKDYDLSNMKRIPGFKNYYAYKDGRIYKKSNSYYRQISEYRQPYSKYLGVYLYNKENEKMGVQVHRLIASAFYRKSIDKYYVSHRDNNIANNKPENLIVRLIPDEILKEKENEMKYLEKNLEDYSSILKNYVNFDKNHYLWKKYIKLKTEKKFRLCYNWLKILLSSKSLI